jgi:hypothetical protein
MKNEKTSMMRGEMPSIMDLEFFSKRFNIRRELMGWGLQKITTAEERTSYIPVVIIRGGQVFIDIKKDCFATRQSIYGREAELLPAIVTETENSYKFSAQGTVYIFTKDEVRTLYERKLMF